jgi:hypothetical protein
LRSVDIAFPPPLFCDANVRSRDHAPIREGGKRDRQEASACAREPISAGHVLLEASVRLGATLGFEPTAADRLVTRMFREAGIAVAPSPRRSRISPSACFNATARDVAMLRV